MISLITVFSFFSFFANANISHLVCFYLGHPVRSFSTNMYMGDWTKSFPIMLCLLINHGGTRSCLLVSKQDYFVLLMLFCLFLCFFFFYTGSQVQHTTRLIHRSFHREFTSLFTVSSTAVIHVLILWSTHKILVCLWTTEAAEKEVLDVSVEKTQPEDCNPEAKEEIQDIIWVTDKYPVYPTFWNPSSY